MAQAISVITIPILTRIYNPSDYGLLGLYMIFTSLIVIFSTFQYSNAIVVAESDEVAKDTLEVSIVINCVVSAISLIAIFFLKKIISTFYHDPRLEKWLMLVPFSVFFIGLNTIFSSWSIRKKTFKLLSYNRIITAMLSPAVSITLGVMVGGPLGLFVGLLLSQILPTLRMSYYFFKIDSLELAFNKPKVISILKKYRNYPLFSLPSEFMNNLSNQFPVLLLSSTGGSHLVGFYNLSVRMLGLPSSLVATSIGDVFRQRAAKDFFSAGSCRAVFMKVFRSLLLFSIFPLLTLLLFGPQIFTFVFGSTWREAGEIAQILAILYACKFVVSPLSYTTYISNKQWLGFVIDLLLLTVLGGVYFISKTNNLDYKTALILFVSCYSTLYLVTFYFSYKFSINEKFISKV